MSARAAVIVLSALALLVPTIVSAAAPDAAALLDGMLKASGGLQAFRELGMIEIALSEEETTANGTQHKKQSTAYVDAATLNSMRLELSGEIVVATNRGRGWATRAGVPDDRPQGSRMAVGTLNQRLFPLLLPFTATMDGVRLGTVTETSFEGQPAWRVAVSFPENFFITPSMATTWYLYLRKDNGALLAAEFFPPPGIRDVHGPRQQHDPRAFAESNLAADDELESHLLRRHVGTHDASERAFVGDRERRVAEFVRLRDQLLRVRGAAQEGEVGKAVELGVGHHACPLRLVGRRTDDSCREQSAFAGARTFQGSLLMRIPHARTTRRSRGRNIPTAARRSCLLPRSSRG